MKLDDFIENVLTDINSGLSKAKSKTGRKYYVDLQDKKGVTFDIAIMAVNSSESQVEGAAKAGFVEVLGAKFGTKLENKEESSQVSRIQFVVFIPYETEEECRVSTKSFQEENDFYTE